MLKDLKTHLRLNRNVLVFFACYFAPYSLALL